MFEKAKLKFGSSQKPLTTSTIYEKKLHLDDNTFKELRDFVYRHSGMYLTDSLKAVLERRLEKRLTALNLDNFTEYLKQLKNPQSNGREITHLMDLITINETGFFRNDAQINAFKNVIIPEIVQLKKSNNSLKIRILSAGCSSGEEPFSLAIILKKYLSTLLNGFDLEILGIDISSEMIATARNARYSKFSVMNVGDNELDKFFTNSGDTYHLSDEIKKMVQFKCMNITDETEMNSLGSFDLIFCKNVLIFFNKESKQKTIHTLYQILQPNGYLICSPTESLHGIEHKFNIIYFVKSFGYQK